MHFRRLVLSICGPSGAGKSQLAKALVERLGPAESVRIPTDYYLAPSGTASPGDPQPPLHYDWSLLAEVLSLPNGTTTTTPDFDFEHFLRRAATGGRPFTLRHIAILDAIYPYPQADLRILLATPRHIRRERIIARDTVWGTQVGSRWERLEMARTHLETLSVSYDLTLPGTENPACNAVAIEELLHEHSRQP